MLKPYRTRVESTEKMISLTLDFLNKNYQNLQKLNQQADDFCASEAFRKEPLPINFTTDFNDSIVVEFKGIDYKHVTSDLSGGDWFQYGDTPTTFQLPMFNRVVATETVKLPEAYIIPPQWTSVIEKLKIHGIEFYTVKEGVDLEVNLYKFSDYSWQENPFEGKHPLTNLTLTEFTKKCPFPAGSVVVPLNQRRVRVIAYMLEPKSSDSYTYWGYFDAITEQKEYSESYSMEKIARQMLAEDPGLRSAFEKWKEENPESAMNSYAILNWFYQQSPWWDQQKDVYPIGRIMRADQVPAME
jgi:hypothetical protein